MTGDSDPAPRPGYRGTVNDLSPPSLDDDRLRTLSVVVPVYNEQSWIARSVEAVISAGDRAGLDLDVVVVDDGSTDGTAETVVRLAEADTRIRLVSQENAGRMAARVTGVTAARHPLVLLLDARVLVREDSLDWIATEGPGYPDARVWCGHVDVETRGNPVAAFWSGLTKIGWRRYMSDPRVVSFGGDDFDRFPKGTGALLIEREYFLELATSFESLYEAQHLASDDTRLLRRAATDRRIWLSPGFSFDYHGKTGAGGLRRQAFFRGTTFVDSYLGQSRTLGAALVGASIGGVGLVALTVARPAVGGAALAAVWCLVPVAVAASGGTRQEVGAAAALTPPFVAVFGAGVVRGYYLAARSALHAQRGARS